MGSCRFPQWLPEWVLAVPGRFRNGFRQIPGGSAMSFGAVPQWVPAGCGGRGGGSGNFRGGFAMDSGRLRCAMGSWQVRRGGPAGFAAVPQWVLFRNRSATGFGRFVRGEWILAGSRRFRNGFRRVLGGSAMFTGSPGSKSVWQWVPAGSGRVPGSSSRDRFRQVRGGLRVCSGLGTSFNRSCCKALVPGSTKCILQGLENAFRSCFSFAGVLAHIPRTESSSLNLRNSCSKCFSSREPQMHFSRLGKRI